MAKRPIRIFLALACWAAAGVAAAEAPQPASAPAGLEAARKAAPAAVAAPEGAAKLLLLAAGLPARDGVSLLAEFAPRIADAKASKACLLRGAELALLLGDQSRAAELFEAAAFRVPASRDDVLLLRSARSRLASGDLDKAQDRALIVLKSVQSAELLVEARLVLGWSLLFGGDTAAARSVAAALLGQAQASQSGQASGAAQAATVSALAAALAGPATLPGSDPRREARFLAWVAASSKDRPQAASALQAEFPSSPEAAIAAANPAAASPSWARLSFLPHWYLSGFNTATPESDVATPLSTAGSSSTDTSRPTAPVTAAPSLPAGSAAAGAPAAAGTQAAAGAPAAAGTQSAAPSAASAASPSSPGPALAPAAASAAGAAGAASASGAIAAAGPVAASPAEGATQASLPETASTVRRFQIGIFSDPRNANELLAELARKGISARIEKRAVGGKELQAVVVEGEADSTVLRLKDAGYEAWPLF